MINVRRERFLGGIIGLVTLGFITGCQHSIEVKEKPPGAEAFLPVPDDPLRIAPLVYVKTVKVIVDGIEGTPSNSLLYRFRTKLLETKLFHDVVFQNPYERYVELNLTVIDKNDQNKAANLTKSMASALTLFLLSPALPLTFEYSSEFQLNLINLEGKSKSYNARSTATLNAPASDPKFMENSGSRSAHSDLYLTVFNYVVNSLMSQMIQDADFIMFIRKEIKPKSDS